MSEDNRQHFETNRESWNRRLDIHRSSAFYDNESFLTGRNSLKDIELGLLGDIKGKSILHLQCHFGQDSISLARMGARVTALDISDESIKYARELSSQCGQHVEFICTNLLDFEAQQKFDTIFTSYGTIVWLPDLVRWASVIQKSLKPGGCFILVDFHPFVMMFDAAFDKISYDYFNTGPIEETEYGSYTDGDKTEALKSVSWNHALSEIIMSLGNAGLYLEHFMEYDYSPYNCFDGLKETGQGQFRFAAIQHQVPIVYSLIARMPDA